LLVKSALIGPLVRDERAVWLLAYEANAWSRVALYDAMRGAASSRDCHREAAQQAIAAPSHAASASQRHQPPKAPSGQHSTAP
jgi:hypothetical protein